MNCGGSKWSCVSRFYSRISCLLNLWRFVLSGNYQGDPVFTVFECIKSLPSLFKDDIADLCFEAFCFLFLKLELGFPLDLPLLSSSWAYINKKLDRFGAIP